MIHMLVTILGAIGLMLLCGLYGDYKKQKTNLEKQGKKIRAKDFFTKPVKIMSIVGVICTFSAFAIIIANSGSYSGSKSKWDSLTKEEKQWYEDNYGGGKSQQYTDAINKYKSTH